MKVRRASLTLILAVALHGCGDDKPGGAAAVVEVAYSNGHPVAVSTTDEGILAVENELFRLTNEHRASIGLPSLEEDPQTRNVARAQSRHMLIHDYFSHTNPEGEGPGERLSRAGVAWQAYGENIAAGYPSAQAAFESWLASPGHRANIEGAHWTHLGVGYWEGADDGAVVYQRYYTQVFLTRP